MRDSSCFFLSGCGEEGTAAGQPVRPGKLQEAHYCLKQRDAFSLLFPIVALEMKLIAEGVV